ncbi:DUF4230 domain-containing protein [Ilyomonas limi]|uniref:DUF4230 domain-containing protein n=1 Tax=Ilyomonas limi TaxID=2575867 RepID=A0A4U3LCA9_9BACT|nr:DUF4230 domain-containing protein [Ilyomonas limi]TKK71706.1 DUF4230 domain-containing protein [Ilyomonas limi]
MLPMNASVKYVGIVGGILLLSIQPGCVAPPSQSAVSGITGLLVLGLILGAVIMFFIMFYINKFTRRNRKAEVGKESSHTVVESMRRVFKIVFAEGHFNEIYTFEDTKKLFGFIPSTRRALVIIEAKVLVGYDFQKCAWEIDEQNQKVKLLSFPEPEILSIEPDYKYYNFDENIFNLLNREDLGRIQTNGKKQVEVAAMKSHLPRIAADQMRTLLLEVVQSKNWQLENIYKITESEAKVITANK